MRRDRRLRPRLATLAVVLTLGGTSGAAGFPLLENDGESIVPQGQGLSAPDANDLRHQLQLVNGFSAPAGGGWTFVPRIDFQEELTDNVYQVHAPRRFDFITFISPGFNLAGDLPRFRISLSYAPSLAIYGETGDLNALTQQLNGLATVTVVPDLAFIDLRAVSGVSNRFGGIGGQGGVGVQAGALAGTQGLVTNGQGLNRNNETQNASFGVTPYLLRDFGDWGTGRLGYALDVTRSDALSGFASAPFPTGGTNAQTLVTDAQSGHYATGDILDRFQDALDIDLRQTQTATDPGYVNGVTGAVAAQATKSRSTSATVSDRITFEVNRSLAVFASGGREDIQYSGAGAQSINDVTWSFGGTLTPGPDSALTLSYGHQQGANSFTANGHYALTARTTITLSYGTTLGTQLENLQNQLNAASVTANGSLVNGTNGGTLFNNTNALAQQDGVFRTSTLTVGSQTSLDKDIVSFNLSLTKQTSTGTGNNGASTNGTTVGAAWVHQMRPDMTLSANLSYSQQDQTSGAGPSGSSLTSYTGSLAWQYQISDTIGTSLRYSFFERSSPSTQLNVYQNLLLLGISKSF
jgi:hypothetical protein